MKKYLLSIAIILVVLCLIFLFPTNVKANTIIVPDDYPTIQRAIDASDDGNTIIVEPGRYVEGINFKGKKITVASRFFTEQDTSYISKTIIDGNKEVPNVVVFESGETSSSKLIGFTITGGYADSDDSESGEDVGGGIRATVVNHFSHPLVSDCIIRDNYARRTGGGVRFYGLTLMNSEIYNNTSVGGGGGISAAAISDGKSSIINCKIYSNSGRQGGGIIYLGYSLSIQNSLIFDNQAEQGGGMCLIMASGIIENTTIYNNMAETGAGIYILNDCVKNNPKTFLNCTITDNNSSLSGGAIHIQNGGECVIINNIIHCNTPQNIFFSPDEATSNLTVAYSNIKGGREGIELNDNEELEWLEGNIDADPLFVDVDSNNYQLREDSPCIDAGTSNFFYKGDIIVDMDESEYFGTAPDMGAYEWWGTSVGQNKMPPPPENRLELYPNPFNPAATIKFSLQKAGDVILSVYNIKGQRIMRLAETFLEKGEHYYSWNGKDDKDNLVTSGVYLVKLEHNDNVAISKITLMK